MADVLSVSPSSEQIRTSILFSDTSEKSVNEPQSLVYRMPSAPLARKSSAAWNGDTQPDSLQAIFLATVCWFCRTLAEEKTFLKMFGVSLVCFIRETLSKRLDRG